MAAWSTKSKVNIHFQCCCGCHVWSTMPMMWHQSCLQLCSSLFIVQNQNNSLLSKKPLWLWLAAISWILNIHWTRIGYIFFFFFILVHKHRYVSGTEWLESSLQQKKPRTAWLNTSWLMHDPVLNLPDRATSQCSDTHKKWEDNQRNLWVIPRAR